MDDDTLKQKMTELAQTFPSMRGARGIDPFDPQVLNRWASGGASHGERVTATFLLAIWDRSTDWEAGRFDLMEALEVWPPSHREPFLRWASDPWWA